MRARNQVLIGLGIAALLIASALALYYRHQAEQFRRECDAAVAELGRTRVAAAKPSPAPAVFKMEFEPSPSGVSTNAAEDEMARTHRPQPERHASRTNRPAPVVVSVPERPADPERPRRRGGDWMENLKATDPQRYEEMQQRRKEMQQYIQDAYNQKTNYFMNRETSTMSDAEFEEYTTMVTLLGQTWELSQRIQSDLPREERWEVMSAVRSNLVVLAPLLDNERNREYYDLAVGMGHSEEEASAFVEYVNQITSNTSLRVILPGIGRGGMPRGGRPPGGNGPGPVPPGR